MINNLSVYRKKANINQKDFAAKIGIGTVTLSKYENPEYDLKNLSVIMLEKICEVLSIRVSDLIKEVE